jgi:GMP synthase-like glutamine amidotransferase
MSVICSTCGAQVRRDPETQIGWSHVTAPEHDDPIVLPAGIAPGTTCVTQDWHNQPRSDEPPAWFYNV